MQPQDRNGLKAALSSQFLAHLPGRDRKAVLVALAWLTRLDKRVTESERIFLHDLGGRLALDDAEIDQAIQASKDIGSAQAAVHAIPSEWVRELLLQQLVAAAFCDGAYDARERHGIRKLAKAAAIPFHRVESWERAFAYGLYERMEHDEELLTTTQEILARRENRQGWSFQRVAQIAAGGVLGGSAVVLSGGAAAPALLAALGASGAVAVAGGLSALGAEDLPTPTVGSGPFGESVGLVASQLFGPDEALTHFALRAATAGLEETSLEYLDGRSGHVVIGVSGYGLKNSDLIADWRALEQAYPFAERYALTWEATELVRLGTCLSNEDDLGDEEDLAEIWQRIQDKARALGTLLAEIPSEGWLGRRPLTLVGFSCGALVILEALRVMGPTQRNISVDSVVLLGGAAPVDEGALCALSKEIGGMFFNGYCVKDAALKRLGPDLIGLQPICADTPTVRNLHFEGLAGDHLAYRLQLVALLEQARAHGA
ncbi:MAG: DUF726 domain-containing protein [Deltaproteobacteria bacterium]|nr:DUF726 domain-containing protein [Deltaproteobacteria bacterium]